VSVCLRILHRNQPPGPVGRLFTYRIPPCGPQLSKHLHQSTDGFSSRRFGEKGKVQFTANRSPMESHWLDSSKLEGLLWEIIREGQTELGCYGLTPVSKANDDKIDYNRPNFVSFCCFLLL